MSGTRRWIWSIFIPFMLFATALFAAIEEIAFREEAIRTHATVNEWHSEKLWGFRGTAMVDIDLGTGRVLENQHVRTHLWYSPAPGDQIPVCYKVGSEGFRMNSVWRASVMPAFLVLISVGWLFETWWKHERTVPDTHS